MRGRGRTGGRDEISSLGPPIYGLAGQKALTDFGWHGVNGETTALRLNFGTKGRRQRLAIETTTEPVDEFRMLMQIVVDIHREHRYPLTIEERSASSRSVARSSSTVSSPSPTTSGAER